MPKHPPWYAIKPMIPSQHSRLPLHRLVDPRGIEWGAGPPGPVARPPGSNIPLASPIHYSRPVSCSRSITVPSILSPALAVISADRPVA